MKLECIGFVNFQPENFRQGIYGLVTIVLERAWAALKCDQLPVAWSFRPYYVKCIFYVILLYINSLFEKKKCLSLNRMFEGQFFVPTHIELKPDFNSKCSFLGYSRQIQTKITRCRIGHTRLTHSYLLTNEQPPFCISCNEPFTVKHFLITCTEFNYIRNRYFTAKTVKELFSDTSSDKIIRIVYW